MKKAIGVLFFAIIIIFLVGCNQSDKVSTKLSDDMNHEDFFIRLHENNDKVVIVYGTTGSEKANLNSEKAAHIYQDMLFRILKVKSSDNIIIKSDSEVTEEDIKTAHIVLTGNPSANSLYREINEKLPIYIDDDKLIIGDKTFNGDKVMFNYLHPNPLNTNKYVWVNGSLNDEYIGINYDLSPQEDYDIKINEKERYRGNFIKGDNKWTVSLGENEFKNEDYVTKESEHFIFLYSDINTNVDKNIEKIIQEREEIYNNISRQVGIEYKDKIKDYLLYDFKALDNHLVYGREGAYLGNMFEVYGERSSVTYHIYKAIMGQKGIPLNQFIEYGFFYYLTMDNVEEGLDIKLDIKDIIEKDKYISFSYMNGYYLDKNLDPGALATELALFSKYLVDTYGMDKYIELYETNTEQEMNDAFVEVYGKDLIQLEDEWLSEIEGN